MTTFESTGPKVSDTKTVSVSRKWLFHSTSTSTTTTICDMSDSSKKASEGGSSSNSKVSDFSIEYILSPYGPGASRFTSWPFLSNRKISVCHEEAEAEEEEGSYGDNNDDDDDHHHRHHHDDSDDSQPKFHWLQCTRYRPPKLHRTRRKEGSRRRKLGRNPRIPFSGSQVAVLEDRFRLGHYLSSSEVVRLSELLCLSETRVKIWFQNRRARERRERDTMHKGKSASGNKTEEESKNNIVVGGPRKQIETVPTTATTFIGSFHRKFASDVNNCVDIPAFENHDNSIIMNGRAVTSAFRKGDDYATISRSTRSAFRPFNSVRFFYSSGSTKREDSNETAAETPSIHLFSFVNN